MLFGELVLRELAVAQRSGASFAILAIDLDGFKAVNDMHGHAAGDTVLKEAADRMANAIRVSDVAARLGGDEFAILLLAGNRESAQAVAEALVESLSLPYANVKVAVSASVGIAVYPQSGTTMLQLLERADVALYRPGAGQAPGRIRRVSGRAGAWLARSMVKLPGFGVPVVRGAGRHERRAAGSRS